MSAEFWMGIAIGSVSPWILVLVMIRRNKQDVNKALNDGSSANELLAKRNEIGRLQVAALQGILHRLEGIFDRMPEPEKQTDAWITRRIYKGTPEHREVVSARFPGPTRVHAEFFPFDGHNWRYSFTSFDDKGEYDQIERPNDGKEGA